MKNGLCCGPRSRQADGRRDRGHGRSGACRARTARTDLGPYAASGSGVVLAGAEQPAATEQGVSAGVRIPDQGRQDDLQFPYGEGQGSGGTMGEAAELLIKKTAGAVFEEKNDGNPYFDVSIINCQYCNDSNGKN